MNAAMALASTHGNRPYRHLSVLRQSAFAGYVLDLSGGATAQSGKGCHLFDLMGSRGREDGSPT